MKITRRKLLKAGVALAGFGRLARMAASAQTGTDYKALVCIFLNGGNDGNNTIVPMDAAGYNNYNSARGILAINQSSLVPVSTPSGGLYGFHPNAPDLANLFLQKQLGVVANVGNLVAPLTAAQYQQSTGRIPEALFSHIDQQRQCQAAGVYTTGWGGRLADVLQTMNGSASFPSAVTLAGGASLFPTGQATQPATVTPGVPVSIMTMTTGPGLARAQAFQEILTFDTGVQLIQSASAITTLGVQEGNTLQAAFDNSTPITTPFPSTNIGQQLQQVAQIIKVRSQLGLSRQIFFCQLIGFDTHVGQLALHATVMQELNDAMLAFYNATTQELGVGSQVTTFTESEFGRTLQPNSGLGSDHAWGNHQLIMGGAVHGGNVFGAFPSLELGGPDDVSGRGVWLPSTAFDQYGATLASWFGVSASSLPSIFPNLPNFSKTNLGFFG